jgi:hypothetical protein
MAQQVLLVLQALLALMEQLEQLASMVQLVQQGLMEALAQLVLLEQQD